MFLLNGDGRRAIAGSSRPLFIHLTVPRYLFDEADFDDPEIRASKLELWALWRKGVGSLLLVIPLSFLLG